MKLRALLAGEAPRRRAPLVYRAPGGGGSAVAEAVTCRSLTSGSAAGPLIPAGGRAPEGRSALASLGSVSASDLQTPGAWAMPRVTLWKSLSLRVLCQSPRAVQKNIQTVNKWNFGVRAIPGQGASYLNLLAFCGSGGHPCFLFSRLCNGERGPYVMHCCDGLQF